MEKYTAESHEKLPFELLKPSQEAAGFIGLLAAKRGAVDLNSGAISIEGLTDDPILEQFSRLGSAIIPALRHERVQKPDKKGNTKKNIQYNHLATAQAIGNFTKDNFVGTIYEKHPWILDQQYIWSFFQQLFDGKISVKDRRFEFKTESEKARNFFYDVLDKLGIPQEKKVLNSSSIYINKKEQRIYIAQHIVSNIPLKEQKLQVLREVPKSTFEIQADLYMERQRISTLLGRIPTLRELDQLSKKGETKFSSKLYRQWFGGGQFAEASQKLLQIDTLTETFSQGKGSATQKELETILKLYDSNTTLNHSTIEVYLSFAGRSIYSFNKFKEWIQNNMGRISASDESFMKVLLSSEQFYEKMLQADSFREFYAHAQKLKASLAPLKTLFNGNGFNIEKPTGNINLSDLKNSVVFQKRMKALHSLSKKDMNKAGCLLVFTYFQQDGYSLEQLAEIFHTSVPTMRQMIDYSLTYYINDYDQALELLEQDRIKQEELDAYVEDLLEKKFSIEEISVWLGEPKRRIYNSRNRILNQ